MKWVNDNNIKVKSTIGISYDNPNITEEDKIRYDACVELDSEQILDNKMYTRNLKGGKYAIVTVKGTYESLDSIYDYFYVKWLEQNKVQLRNEPSFEVYKNMVPEASPEDYITEIYFPIV